jgi:tetratricopeptide (TPR) repeat protein
MAGRAAAQDPRPASAAREQARALYERGTTEYRLGYFDEAARIYEQAYRLLPDAALLYDVGQAYRFAGQREKALVAYRSYLRTSAPDAPKREAARKFVEDLAGAPAAPGPAAAISRPVRLEAVDLPVGPPALVAAPSRGAANGAPPPVGRPRWWLWGALGALVVGGVATTVVLAGRPHAPMSGSVGVAEVP